MNSLDPASRVHLLQTLARVDPRSLSRFATTSRSALQNTQQISSRINALRRVVRRKIARKRMGRRLSSPLFRAKQEAVRRSRMTAEQRRHAIRRHIVRESDRAFIQYFNNPSNATWNRFVRVYVKSGGRPNITRNQARALHRHLI